MFLQFTGYHGLQTNLIMYGMTCLSSTLASFKNVTKQNDQYLAVFALCRSRKRYYKKYLARDEMICMRKTKEYQACKLHFPLLHHKESCNQTEQHRTELRRHCTTALGILRSRHGCLCGHHGNRQRCFGCRDWHGGCHHRSHRRYLRRRSWSLRQRRSGFCRDRNGGYDWRRNRRRRTDGAARSWSHCRIRSSTRTKIGHVAGVEIIGRLLYTIVRVPQSQEKNRTK